MASDEVSIFHKTDATQKQRKLNNLFLDSA